jgi:uncharacterized repeat protein (TIGR03803 family)
LSNYGNLYGTGGNDAVGGGYVGGGYVFELSPPPAGSTQWSFHILYDGFPGTSQPSSGLFMDKLGNLYGATSEYLVFNAQTNGTVFELSPPSAEQTTWSFTNIHKFCLMSNCSDGMLPSAVIMDGTGNLYGTTASGGANGAGTVFELSPPPVGKTSWTEKNLYNFCAQKNCGDGYLPGGGVILDVSGNLYGTTAFGGYTGGATGTMFKLSPPGAGTTRWTETILHDLCWWKACPWGRDIAGLTYRGAASGALYDGISPIYAAASSGGYGDNGTLFALTP